MSCSCFAVNLQFGWKVLKDCRLGIPRRGDARETDGWTNCDHRKSAWKSPCTIPVNQKGTRLRHTRLEWEYGLGYGHIRPWVPYRQNVLIQKRALLPRPKRPTFSGPWFAAQISRAGTCLWLRSFHASIPSHAKNYNPKPCSMGLKSLPPSRFPDEFVKDPHYFLLVKDLIQSFFIFLTSAFPEN